MEGALNRTQLDVAALRSVASRAQQRTVLSSLEKSHLNTLSSPHLERIRQQLHAHLPPVKRPLDLRRLHAYSTAFEALIEALPFVSTLLADIKHEYDTRLLRFAHLPNAQGLPPQQQQPQQQHQPQQQQQQQQQQRAHQPSPPASARYDTTERPVGTPAGWEVVHEGREPGTKAVRVADASSRALRRAARNVGRTSPQSSSGDSMSSASVHDVEPHEIDTDHIGSLVHSADAAMVALTLGMHRDLRKPTRHAPRTASGGGAGARAGATTNAGYGATAGRVAAGAAGSGGGVVSAHVFADKVAPLYNACVVELQSHMESRHSEAGLVCKQAWGALRHLVHRQVADMDAAEVAHEQRMRKLRMQLSSRGAGPSSQDNVVAVERASTPAIHVTGYGVPLTSPRDHEVHSRITSVRHDTRQIRARTAALDREIMRLQRRIALATSRHRS